MKQLRPRARAMTLIVLLGWLATMAQVAAQAGTGTLSGTVVDDQGAAIPGAGVTVTEQATGAMRTTASGPEGTFRLPGLPAGRYTIDITQTATSSRMATVTSEQLTNIPMKGRDLFGLLTVVPGVQDTNLNRDFSTWTSMGAITINGMPNRAKNVVVDGVSVVDELGTNAMINPNIDAVGEVQVISNGFTAENGRGNGGLILITTKSGTNQLRGSAWYNVRRDNWNANEYFRIKQNLDKPLYHVNIPGYGIGGPVLIPKLLDRGKVFFFASQEFTDDLRPSTITRVNYPTELERIGDFSQTYFGNANGSGQGTLQVIINPDTGLPFDSKNLRRHPGLQARPHRCQHAKLPTASMERLAAERKRQLEWIGEIRENRRSRYSE